MEAVRFFGALLVSLAFAAPVWADIAPPEPVIPGIETPVPSPEQVAIVGAALSAAIALGGIAAARQWRRGPANRRTKALLVGIPLIVTVLATLMAYGVWQNYHEWNHNRPRPLPSNYNPRSRQEVLDEDYIGQLPVPTDRATIPAQDTESVP